MDMYTLYMYLSISNGHFMIFTNAYNSNFKLAMSDFYFLD